MSAPTAQAGEVSVQVCAGRETRKQRTGDTGAVRREGWRGGDREGLKETVAEAGGSDGRAKVGMLHAATMSGG